MKLLAPQHNALFLRSWWPATRPVRLVSFAVLVLGILAVVVFGCYLSGLDKPEMAETWPRVAFGISLALQALIVVIGGTYHVGSAAYQEAATGAIDFHRASATSPGNQALGLVFGPGTLTWILLAVSLPVTFLCMLLGGVSPGDYVAVLVSLVLTGILFHVLAAAVGLTAKRATPRSLHQVAGVVIAALVVIVTIGFASSEMSLVSFLSGYPVAALAVVPEAGIESAFYGVALPPLLVQVIVQLPLLAVAGAALRRAVAYPNRPPLSKPLALGLAGWLFVVLLGSLWDTPFYGLPGALDDAVVGVLLFAFVLGAVELASATPRFALYSNGLRRRRKLGLTGLRPFDDATGNSLWVVCYAVLAAGLHNSMGLLGDSPRLEPLVAMLLSLGWFAAALEFFRLGPARLRGAVCAAVIAVLWVLLPAFGFVSLVFRERWTEAASYLMSTCPIFAVIGTIDHRGVPQIDRPPQPATTVVVLVVNALLFVIFTALAASARAAIAQRVAGKGRAEGG